MQTKEYYELTAEQIVDGEDDQKDFASGRFAVDYRYKFPRDIAFFARGSITQSFDESDDWRGRGETGVSTLDLHIGAFQR